MEIITDLHIHSKYSRAVSKFMDLNLISSYALRKGIDIIATGDWQHPTYFKEIKTNLIESLPGLYKLKDNSKSTTFFLSTEVVCIYKDKGKGRRIHFLIFSPSLEVCEKVINEFNRRKLNLTYDARPIFGISSKELLKILLNIDDNILLVPAHIWTPWFGLYGSRSGYDSIKECFEELEDNIYAIETGLSSDPLMNWKIKELDDRTILSFSDAHSAPKIGRETTIFHSDEKLDYSYTDIVSAIKNENNSKLDILCTAEFYPEEGMYHWSGHRKCNVRLNPIEVKKEGNLCPICKRPLTEGVDTRVETLANKELTNEIISNKIYEDVVSLGYQGKIPYISLIPLQEILIQILKSKTKGIREYDRITQIKPEFQILLNTNYKDLENIGGKDFSETIRKIRNREVKLDPGYDGIYGKFNIL